MYNTSYVHIYSSKNFALLSIRVLCFVLQNDRSQTDLIAKLSNVSMHNPDVMQQMYCLYDGTITSLDNAPDIRMFTNQLPGLGCCCSVCDEQQPIGVMCRLLRLV